MPATPYAKLLVSLGGGAPVSGGLSTTTGVSVQLTGENTVGWLQQRFEISDYPVGFAPPAGWSTDPNTQAYFYATTASPPPFTPSVWGKYITKLTVNGGLNGAGNADPTLLDITTSLSIPSPGGLLDLGFQESLQFSALKLWTGDQKKNLRVIEAGITAAYTVGLGTRVRKLAFADSPVTAVAGDFILLDTTGGNILVTVPSAAASKVSVEKDTGDAHTVTISADVGTISGAANQVISVQWAVVTTVGVGGSCRLFP